MVSIHPFVFSFVLSFIDDSGAQLSVWLDLLSVASDVNASPVLRHVAVDSLVCGGGSVLRVSEAATSGASGIDIETRAGAWIVAARLLEDDDVTVRVAAAEFVHQCVPLVECERANSADSLRLTSMDALYSFIVEQYGDTRAAALFISRVLITTLDDAAMNVEQLLSGDKSVDVTPVVFRRRWSNRLPLFEVESSNNYSEPLQAVSIILKLLERFIETFLSFVLFFVKKKKKKSLL